MLYNTSTFSQKQLKENGANFGFHFQSVLKQLCFYVVGHFSEIMDSPEQPSYCDLWDGTFNAMFHSANVVLGIGYRLVFHIQQSTNPT